MKNSFPNITLGNKKYLTININEEKNNVNNNIHFTYIDQINNLLKKSKIFFDFFFNEGIIKSNDCMHILYLYNESNIYSWEDDFDQIENNINTFLKDVQFKKFNNIIFQVAYFDKEKNINETINKMNHLIKEKDDKIKEKDDKIKEKDDKIKEKDDEIKEKDDKIKEKDDEIERLKELLKKHNIDFK